MNNLVRTLPWLLLPALALGTALHVSTADRHLLYVASPGIRNYVEYGGVGILVFDLDGGFQFVKRIPTFSESSGKEPEPVKGVAANAKTGRLYVTTPTRLLCIDLVTEKPLWEKQIEGGCDRMSLSPDGKTLYVPSFEGPHWTVVNALTGDVVAKIETKSGAHNTIYGPNGKQVYMAGLKSPVLYVADAEKHTIGSEVGPFSNVIRPFTINSSQTRCFANVNELLGFEVGDLTTGKLVQRVEVSGYKTGPTKRHGCPSHGIALTPDERELWLSDSFNSRLHIFDATSMPPREVASVALRDQPGWITFSIDGRLVFPSTGEIIDAKTRRIIGTLTDEQGRAVQSEKLLEIDFRNGRPVRAGDQFAIGQRKSQATNRHE